jgi:hypothetical protein
MKFTLTYEGSLPSSGSRPKNQAKSNIRSHFHSQLVELWKSHPALLAVEDNRHFPKTGGAMLAQVHHLYPGPIQVMPWTSGGRKEILDLCEPIDKHGAWFRPLVRESYALHCGLKILFLRREPPGKVYQGGDVDGRIKTLLDALTMPQHAEQVLEKNDKSAPTYCLLEDDSMVSSLQVESERLLSNSDQSVDYVRLVIEIDVRVRQARIYNQPFL